jgi:hypothetical protein
MPLRLARDDGVLLLCVAVTALVAPVAADSSIFNDLKAYKNTLDEPSGGWTACPAPVQAHLGSILGWEGTAINGWDTSCMKTDLASCEKLYAVNLASTSKYSYMFGGDGAGPSTFWYKAKGTSTGRADEGYVPCTQDSDCAGLCAGMTCNTAAPGGGRCKAPDMYSKPPPADSCYGNWTTMTGMTTAKFLELCSPTEPTAATTCPDAIKNEAAHIDRIITSEESPRIEDSKADTDYRIRYPSGQTHTMVFTKHNSKLYQGCSSDADCNFCNAFCYDAAGAKKCYPKVQEGIITANDCFTTTYHPGVSMDKLGELCSIGSTGGKAANGTTSASGSAAGQPGLRASAFSVFVAAAIAVVAAR